MSDRPRAIVHLDLDAFYAAVEMLERPELVGKALLIGGSPEERGVVSTASYAARAFGVHSAMPTYRALQLCPQAIVLPPRHRLYRDYSRRVMAILRQAAALLEQVSIDEAYLDLTDQVKVWDEVIPLARQLQRDVRRETGLSASLGVATNKLVAKVASDQNKPGGLTVVPPGEEAAFLAPLPVRVLWGIGPVTAGKLAAMGVTAVGELAHLTEGELTRLFGRQGAAMARQARGQDRRRVVTEHEPKSVSQERTFVRDLAEEEALKEQLWKMSQGVARQLKRTGLAAATVAIKLRYADFTTLSRQMTLTVPTDSEREIYRAATILLARAWKPRRPVRLLGVAGRHLTAPAGQLPLL
jgi:DNA polymerase-4